MKSERYTPSQVVLHWISAVIILWVLISGFYVAIFEVSRATKDRVGFVNVSLTTLYIPVFILRIYCSFLYGLSARGPKQSVNEYMALFVHKAIYLTLGVVLVTGVLMMDRPINVFNVLIIKQVLTDAVAIAWFAQVHIQACVVLLVLVCVHVGAAIKHELTGHRVLKNMVFPKK